MNIEYLSYFLLSPGVRDFYKSKGAGGLQINISKKDILSLEISFPKSLTEQKRIVKILDEVFGDIEEAKENAEKNLENVKELFESELQNVFENPEKDWEIKKLGEVCDFFNGKPHEQDVSENGEFIIVNSKFISSDGKVKKFTSEQKMSLVKNDLVFVMSDVPNGKALGKFYIIDQDKKYSLNQRIGLIKNKGKFDNDFLYWQLNRNKYFLDFNNGENQTNLRKGDILECPLFIPPITEQKRIVKIFDELSGKVGEMEAILRSKIPDLDELKKSVLKKAFDGEL